MSQLSNDSHRESIRRIKSCLRSGGTELNLQGLGLSSLPGEIQQLTQLTHLYLNNNNFSSVPPEIFRLHALQTINFQKNNLTYLPVELAHLPDLEYLFLHGNNHLNLSPAIIGTDPSETNEGWSLAKTILDFYFARQFGSTRPLNEVKLMIVGRGGAGKTSTVNALCGRSLRADEESTPGIALQDLQLKGQSGEPITVHVWDFAGQVITHALHQFFFSTRCIYMVVLTGRENSEREDAEYWLRLIAAFGTDEHGSPPPVIISLNKWEAVGCRAKIDREALKERYPFIRHFVEMDCTSTKRTENLKRRLTQEVNKLRWLREPFPVTWDRIRRELSGPHRSTHLPYAAFRKLCATHGVTGAGEQDSLAEILHNLGAALNFRRDPRLREATVLQPDWLTSNVYSLLRKAEELGGMLTQEDVDLVLDQEPDPKMRHYLVQLMERFEIAYPANKPLKSWLLPQALPDSQPPSAADFRDITDATRLRYLYQAIPEGLVPRVIVRLHEFIELKSGRPQQWSSGAIFARDEARAMIRTEPQDRQIAITITGPVKPRQQLAGLCLTEMREIHSDIRSLDPIEETMVLGNWVRTSTLENDERRGQLTGIATINGTVVVNPTEANNAFSKPPARSRAVWKPTVFISYSKENLNRRKRLEQELKILMNEGLIERHWHDRMITGGEDWDDLIQRELSEADVIILLLSTAALATDYIWQKEIPKALELHRAGKAVLVPIILETCRISDPGLRSINGLPEKSKALNLWKPISLGWHSIANGLAVLFEKMIREGPVEP